MLPAQAVRAQGKTSGVALVIGNSKYQWEAPLPNVRRDAPDIAKRLQALGLRTELVQDAGRAAMQQAIDKFAAASKGAQLSVFYFAGHGAAWANDTYLVPLDADLGNPNTVKSLVPVASISTAMDGAANRLVVFDNCRNNPADGWQQKEAEKAAFIGDAMKSVPRTPNTLVLFSTAPGRVALDGPAGENSPFAANLLRQLDGQSVDLQALPTRLRRDLLIATEGRQVVLDLNTYTGPFVVSGPATKAPGAGASSWAGDPARIVELPNMYAFSDQHGLQLPRGLIAHRPPAGAPHANKVGAFKFDNPVPDGGRQPGAIVLLSAEEQGAAEVIFVTRLGGRGGWRFVRPTLSNDTLTYETRDKGPRYVFKWKDANSGSLAVFPPSTARNNAPTTSSFTRLDG